MPTARSKQRMASPCGRPRRARGFRSRRRRRDGGTGLRHLPFAADPGDAGPCSTPPPRRALGGGHVGLYRPRPDRETLLLETLQSALRADASNRCSSRSPAGRRRGRTIPGPAAPARRRRRAAHTAAEVVPVAERAGPIGEIDRWVLTRCLMVLTSAPAPAARCASSPRSPCSVCSIRPIWPGCASNWNAADRRQPPGVGAARRRPGRRACHVVAGRLLVQPARTGRTGPWAASTPVPRSRPGWMPPCWTSSAWHRVAWASAAGDAHAGGAGARTPVGASSPRRSRTRRVRPSWSAGVDYIQGNFVQQADQELNLRFPRRRVPDGSRGVQYGCPTPPPRWSRDGTGETDEEGRVDDRRQFAARALATGRHRRRDRRAGRPPAVAAAARLLAGAGADGRGGGRIRLRAGAAQCRHAPARVPQVAPARGEGRGPRSLFRRHHRPTPPV